MAIILKPKSMGKSIVVPDGTYQATLSKVTQFQNAFGDRVGFEFTLQDGHVEGIKLQRTTNVVLSPKSKLNELLTGLMGRPLNKKEMSEGINTEKLIGTKCQLLVMQSRSKTGEIYSNIERVMAI